LLEAGDLTRAESTYRQVLGISPQHADALLGLADIALRSGRGALALELIERAIATDPQEADFHGALGAALAAQGRWLEALTPFQAAVSLRPGDHQSLLSLAEALWKTGSFDDGARAFLQASDLAPGDLQLQRHIADALRQMGRANEAIHVLKRLLASHPDDLEALNAAGVALVQVGEVDKAIASFERFVELRPADPVGYNNLAAALGAAGRTEEIIETFHRALKLNPNYATGHHNLANALKDHGEIEEAIAAYDAAASLDPGYGPTQSNRLFALHFHPQYDAHAIFREHQAWGRRHSRRHAARRGPLANDPAPQRRLRVGYVSSDFRAHVVGWNLRPLFAHHSHDQFEIHCYADVRAADELTGLLRSQADVWRDICGLSDDLVADRIREDQIDLLVDLSLHTDGNRLAVFAQKPAPVQISYLGYCGTSGLEEMDYRLSDPYLDPPGCDEGCYSEQTILLPRTYWCYQPGGATPQPSRLPADHAGFVTFCCLNNFAKASTRALALWGRILRQTPRSRLLLHGPSAAPGGVVHWRLERAGVPLDRVQLLPRHSWTDYIQTYQGADIALDPFPFSGGITTCDSLWMGVPVVSLRGRTAVGRGGASILANVGLSELVADDEEGYLRLAVALANDRSRLIGMRNSLRGRMQRSPLMDAASFARDIETAYRDMWRRWCERHQSPG
jgi:predicted O-linked N-acetylglucosamine transferase (SPINDLY family)